MKRIYNVALVGCGAISKNHLTALSKIASVKVTALCDVRPERAVSCLESFSLDANIYTDYKEMLENERLDAVHICTPHCLHASMTTEALARGIYVFLEKPMAISLEEIEEIIAAEQKSTASVCVCFQNRFSPSVMLALNMAKEDGGALSGYASVFWDRGEKYYTESDWRGKYATEGGGVMINQAIHVIDLLCEFLGVPETVKGKSANFHLDGIIEVEDSCGGVITHAGGVKSNFYATTAAEKLCSTVIYVKTKKHIIEVRNYRLYVDGEFVDTSEHTLYVGKACYGNGHETLIDSFYRAIESGAEMPVTAESAKWALRVLLAAYTSDGKAVYV